MYAVFLTETRLKHTAEHQPKELKKYTAFSSSPSGLEQVGCSPVVRTTFITRVIQLFSGHTNDPRAKDLKQLTHPRSQMLFL